MIIEDVGILLHLKALKESGLIATFFTKEHGKLAGFMRKPNSKFGSDLIPGNFFMMRWKARLEEHLGNINVEIIQNNFQKTMTKRGRSAISYILGMLMRNFKEKASAIDLYQRVMEVIDIIDTASHLELLQAIFRFEIALLQDMGFGINLQECALTGSNTSEPLHYISPKTGAACTLAAGQPYHDKLFIIPEFFRSNTLKESELGDVSKILIHYLNQYDLISDELNTERIKVC